MILDTNLVPLRGAESRPPTKIIICPTNRQEPTCEGNKARNFKPTRGTVDTISNYVQMQERHENAVSEVCIADLHISKTTCSDMEAYDVQSFQIAAKNPKQSEIYII